MRHETPHRHTGTWVTEKRKKDTLTLFWRIWWWLGEWRIPPHSRSPQYQRKCLFRSRTTAAGTENKFNCLCADPMSALANLWMDWQCKHIAMENCLLDLWRMLSHTTRKEWFIFICARGCVRRHSHCTIATDKWWRWEQSSVAQRQQIHKQRKRKWGVPLDSSTGQQMESKKKITRRDK